MPSRNGVHWTAHLSPREEELVEMLAEGTRPQEAASRLDLPLRTIHRMVYRAYDRLPPAALEAVGDLPRNKALVYWWQNLRNKEA